MAKRVKRIDPSLLVILGGITAALHIGKLPPALPVLQASLGISLVQAGFLLSLVQLAGMTLGLAVGLAADGLGLKRTMVWGLFILSAASFAGGWASDVATMLALRAVEGLGFLLASMPAPSLIRRLVVPQRLQISLGLWGTYMPLGTAIALLLGPTAIQVLGWPGWWWLIAAWSLLVAMCLVFALPSDPMRGTDLNHGKSGWPAKLRATLSARGPWLVALSFGFYSAQWLAVIGFLPSIYSKAGVGGAAVGLATALAAAVNIVGNVVAGRLLQRGVLPGRLLYAGYFVMGVASLLIFVPISPEMNRHAAVTIQYLAVLLFSMVGGMIPATLFSLSVRFAPSNDTVSTTVGWMQQWSSLGQFLGVPMVAWVATRAGGWQWSWVVTSSCALAGLALARTIAAALKGP
jgi:CP family cyanate transporter-like MFS transporter